MSKKRNKSPTNAANNSLKWETNIITADLTEENWSYSLAFLVESIPEDSESINYINRGISTGLRKRFTLITMDKINQLIAEFGNPKAKKSKDAPLNFEICEAGKIHLDKGEIMPVPLLARLIKWIILTNKADDLRNLADANKKTGGKPTKAKKPAEKNDRVKSSGGKKGSQTAGKRSPEPPSVKHDNKLRKRGDPDPDIQYIDDEPDDGSSRYFIVSGMVDCNLLEALTDIGCVATSIIKVTRDVYIPIEKTEEGEVLKDNISTASSQEVDEGESNYEKQLASLEMFWSNLNNVLNNNKHLLNAPILTLEIKHLMFPIDKENEELQKKCSMELFEALAVLKYDLLDLKRQWQNYLCKSKLISLPMKSTSVIKDDNTPRESIKDGALPAGGKDETISEITFDKSDMEYYHFLLQDIPVESTSIYLQLSAMLDQVEVTCGERTPDSNITKSDSLKENSENTGDILKTMIESLYLPDDDLIDLKNSLKIVPEECDSKGNTGKNVSIHALDSITLRDREIGSKDLGLNGIMGRELQMLVASFRHLDLLKPIPINENIYRKRAARLQELLKYFDNTGLSQMEINYAIKIFILENLTLSGVDENGFIRTNNEDGISSKTIHPIWDDPYMIVDDVTQSIVDDEISLIKKEFTESDNEAASFLLSEATSSLIKGETQPDGILKSSRHSSRSQSPDPARFMARKSSVHFVDMDIEEQPLDLTETQYDIMMMLNEEDNSEMFQNILLDYLLNMKKRCFNEWCFEEFYEPHVLLQIIHHAFYKLPYVDIYNQRRVDSKIVVLHNPFQPDTKLNQQSWNQWLHANVGFRNYLDYVNDKIRDWNRDQEAIYQANLLNKELQTMESEPSDTETKDKPTKANDKSKKSRSKSRSGSNSRASSGDETSHKELTLVLPGSLKAQKMEQERINKAKEEEELKKEQKRKQSPRKNVEKEIKDDEKPKDNKRSSSKTSDKSKTKKTTFENSSDSFEKENTTELELVKEDHADYWPFISYNLGDDLAHFSGNVVHLFPSDGSTIRVIKMQKLLDSTSVRVSVITPQSHVFTVHIIDPIYVQDPVIDNYDKVLEQFQNSRRICHYGASTCTFNDGIIIAASNNGYTGTCFKTTSKSNSFETSGAENASQKSIDNLNLGKRVESFQSVNEAFGKKAGFNSKYKDHMDLVDMTNLILTTPDGVQVRVGYESTGLNEAQYHILLYMSKSTGNMIENATPDATKNTVMENGRYITADGRVITIYNDNSIKVLFVDGTVAVSHLSVSSCVHPDEEAEESKLEKANVKESPTQKRKAKQKSISVDQPILSGRTGLDESKQMNYFRKWTVTLSNGEIFETEADLNSIYGPKVPTGPKEIPNEEPVNEEKKELIDTVEITEPKNNFKAHQMKEPFFVSSATDPLTGETLITRSDGTLILESEDCGIFLSEHSDGTRFTKYFVIEKIPNLQSDGRENNKSKVTELLLIESRNYPSVSVDVANGKIETRFGSMGSVLSDSNGSHTFKHSDNTEIEYRFDGEMIFTPSQNSQMSYLQPEGPCSYMFNPTSNIICEMMDSEGTEFVVDVNGDFQVKSHNKAEKPICEPSNDEEQNQDPEHSRPSGSAISMSTDNSGNIRKYDHHAPRVFTINHDGSGSELLRYRDVVDVLVTAEIEDDYFNYQEEIQDSPQIIAHTIIHPDSPKKPWKYDYSRKTILPKGLTCRDMKTFPAKENIVKGPKFAMGIGKGLEINPNPTVTEPIKKPKKNTGQSLWTNPMQYRQFYHYPIITNDIRNSFAKQIVQYNKKILHQRQQYKNLELIDERSDEEKIEANEIRKRFEIMKYSDKQIMRNATRSLRSADKEPFEGVVNEKLKSQKANGKEKSTPNQRKLDMILEQEKINKEKEMKNKLALMHKTVPNYFTSIYGKEFISSQAMDLQSLNKSMKLFSVSRERSSTGDFQFEPEQDSAGTNESVNGSVQSLRSKSSSSDVTSQPKKQDSVDNIKDKNGQFQSNLVIKKKEKKYLYYDSSLFLQNIPKRTPITSDLNLPNYLYAQRPVIEPNIRQAMIEDPVRRKMYTTSLIGGSHLSQIFQRQTRGINVLPARVDTGLLKEGQNYIFKIKLINTGPESSYFKIKQPPSNTGIWVEFLPGPIAAGLSRKIAIHIYAIANNSSDSLIEHSLEVTTNTDKLVIPITARVMTAERYDSIYPEAKSILQNSSTISQPPLSSLLTDISDPVVPI